MTNSIAKRRRLSLIAVFAVVASVFVLPAVPASATPGTADDLATYSACPAGSAPASNFSDVSASSFAKSAIDCIKMFGVTQGTSATTYSPGDGVTRWQMALFLIRAARPAGITVPAAADQGFTDIADLPQSTQDAINQLKQLGIAAGTSATTFSPNDVVSRYQMALFLARFLDDVLVGPGGKDIAVDVTPDDTNFTDIGGVSFEAYNAIRNLFEMGVTTGTSATTFGPYDSVTREQMAAFIARTLNHSNARPAGVSIQSDIASGFGLLNPILSISVRDASFQPVVNALVDIFRFQGSTTVTSAFATDGTCVTTGEVTAVSSGANVCKLDLADNATNADGNIPSWGWTVTSGKTGTFYAWTGTSGATFDNDTTASSNVSVVSSPGALSTVASWNLPANASIDTGRSVAKFGTVTYTFQLNDAADGTGDPVAQAGQTVTYDYTLTTASGTESKTGQTVKTDANGAATVSFTVTDPNAATGDTATLDIVFNGPGADVIDMADEDVVFKDGAAAATTLVLSQDSAYTIASDVGIGATHTARGTVYDQYGNPKSGIDVTFSNEDELLSTPLTRTTDGSGVATVSWDRDDATAEADTLSGVAGSIADTGDLNVYWVVELADAGTVGASTVLVADAANDAIVYAGSIIVYYDSNDQFKVGGVAKSYAEFDAAVAADDGTSTIAVTAYAASPSGISQFNYTP